MLYFRCGFRVLGENENGKGKWSEESVVVVPQTNSNSSGKNGNTSKRKKRKRKKGNSINEIQLYRTELNDILQDPTEDVLEKFIKKLQQVEDQNSDIKAIIEDAKVALQIKQDEIALRKQFQILEKHRGIEEDLIKAQNTGNIEELEQSIERARKEGISIHQAEKALQQLKRVTDVRTRLQSALESNNIEELEAAIDIAEQWENSQLRLEIQACTDKIKALSIPSEDISNIFPIDTRGRKQVIYYFCIKH